MDRGKGNDNIQPLQEMECRFLNGYSCWDA